VIERLEPRLGRESQGKKREEKTRSLFLPPKGGEKNFKKASLGKFSLTPSGVSGSRFVHEVLGRVVGGLVPLPGQDDGQVDGAEQAHALQRVQARGQQDLGKKE